jgi:hypothetical protein
VTLQMEMIFGWFAVLAGFFGNLFMAETISWK